MRQQAMNLQRVLGKMQPDPEQLPLFEEAPAKRGFAWPRGLTERQKALLFEAVLLLALAQAHEGEVFLFVPRELSGWATEQIRRVASEMFARCKKAKQVQVAEHLGKLYRALLIGSRVTPATPEPERWAVYGFETDEATLPKWLTDAQLPVYAFLRDDEDL